MRRRTYIDVPAQPVAEGNCANHVFKMHQIDPVLTIRRGFPRNDQDGVGPDQPASRRISTDVPGRLCNIFQFLQGTPAGRRAGLRGVFSFTTRASP